MKEKKIITEYFDGVKRIEKSSKSFPKNSPLIKSGLKLTLATTFSFLLLLSVSSVGGTVSYFNDTEGVFNNYFRADPISFKVETSSEQIDLSEDRKIDLVMTPDEISDPIQYFVTGKIISGDNEFCSGINIVGSEPFNVSTKVDLLNTDISTTTGMWTITASVPDGLKSPGKSCQVELTYLGWNDGSILGKSFTDTRKVNLLFFIPSTYKTKIFEVLEVPDTSVEIQSSTSLVSEPTPEPTKIVEDDSDGKVEESSGDNSAGPSSEDDTTNSNDAVVPEVTPTPTPEVTTTPEPTVTPTPADIPVEIVDSTPSQS